MSIVVTAYQVQKVTEEYTLRGLNRNQMLLLLKFIGPTSGKEGWELYSAIHDELSKNSIIDPDTEAKSQYPKITSSGSEDR